MPEKISGIYRVKNAVTGQSYIGSAIDVLRRWKDHTRLLNSNRHHSIKLQRSWEKHGAKVFNFEIVETLSNLTKEIILGREQFWIDKENAFGAGYNMNKTAGSKLGMESSAETKIKQSMKLKGIPKSEEHKRNISASKTGSKRTEEFKIQQSARMKGRTLSEQHIENISKSLKGRVVSGEHKAASQEGLKRSRKRRELAGISHPRKGIPLTSEHTANIRASKRGVPQSESHKANRAASRKASDELRKSQGLSTTGDKIRETLIANNASLKEQGIPTPHDKAQESLKARSKMLLDQGLPTPYQKSGETRRLNSAANKIARESAFVLMTAYTGYWKTKLTKRASDLPKPAFSDTLHA